MKNTLRCFFAVSLLSALPSLAEEEGFVSLFDGKTLNGWTSARELDGKTNAFTVNKEEKAMHIYAGCEADSKQGTDCLNTEKEFSHYILKLEYKWLENLSLIHI